MEWWMIRHGITEWNAARKYQGHSDTELLPGEAAGLGPLRTELAGVSFSAVYCSNLSRCRSTLERTRPDLTGYARYDGRLREMNFGTWEGQTYDMLKDDEAYRSWIDNPQAVTPPGGESWLAFERRVFEVYEELAAYSRQLVSEELEHPLLIVAHGGVISLLATRLLPGAGFRDIQAKITPGEVLKLQFPF
ncbi:histidine phosphatase family protein [Paenibacillus sp. M1]|uniref:Histidine phosphatase family protein n=1 Tax=Paenibacillus haidiansis TaxID=1574488 RepID=A0ABU7VTJ1_9BACL